MEPMKNDSNIKVTAKPILTVFTDHRGTVFLQYSLPGLRMRVQILEKLITQYSNN
jgi:hypothetical protein